ncbi:MAG: N-acetylmuramic acid 6-phosphate etherase [Clostridia bacterium]|nr:N-acetylmuramic acid 6-phosphate etherase [Clostridia bacterium]
MLKEYINTEGLDNTVTHLATEQRNPNTENIADVSVEEMLYMINREDATVADKVKEAVPQIAKAVDLLVERMSKGGRLVYMAAGTSARLGFMDAAECPPTYGVELDKVTCLMAGGRGCVFQAQELMEDSTTAAVTDLKEFGLTPLDTVVAAAASGRTPYCVAGLKYAKEIGAGAVSIACNLNSEMGKYADVAIELNTGAESIMGSTRMKAGTAQKMTMNMMSTAVMVRLNRTYGNILLPNKEGNTKFNNRTLRYLAEALNNPDLAYAKSILEKANGSARCAIVMEVTGADFATAKEASDYGDGDLKKTMARARELVAEKNK